LAFGVRDAVGLIGARKPTAADPENQPAMADLIDGGGFFGNPQRVA
jgi:hypothetical protein